MRVNADLTFVETSRQRIQEAVAGNALAYVHKEQEVADIQRRYPADHYAIVDDKPRIHAAMKAVSFIRAVLGIMDQ